MILNSEGNGDPGLPVGGSQGVLLVVMGLVYGTGDVGDGDQALASTSALREIVAKCCDPVIKNSKTYEFVSYIKIDRYILK